MRILELFDSRDKKKRMSHIKNLVALILADGVIEKDELDLVFKIATTAGISPQEFKRILDRPDSISFFPPESFMERVEQLYDMVLVMMVDGNINPNEVAVCQITAKSLGFKHEIVAKIVADVIDSVAKGLALEMVIRDLNRRYSF